MNQSNTTEKKGGKNKLVPHKNMQTIQKNESPDIELNPTALTAQSEGYFIVQ